MYGTSVNTTDCTLPQSAPRFFGSASALNAASAASFAGELHQPGAPSPSCGGVSVGSGSTAECVM